MTTQSAMRSGILITLGTMVSRVLGLARQMILVYAIGSVGIAANAYGTAGRIPYIVYTLIISGALTSVLVPQITKASVHADKGQAYIQKLVTFTLVIGLSLSALTAALSPLIIDWLTPGWSDTNRNLALIFSLWLTPEILLFALFTIAGEVLNAKSLFGPYAWAPVVNNVVQISFLLMFCVFFGAIPYGTETILATDPHWSFAGQLCLAGGATLGIASQTIILFAYFKRAGVKLKLDFKWRGSGLMQTGKIASWTLGTAIISQLVALASTVVYNRATGDEAGVAVINITSLVTILPHSIIVISVVMVSFTRMSHSVSSGDISGLRENLSRALSLTELSIFWCSAVLCILAFEISQILQPAGSEIAISNSGIAVIGLSLGSFGYSGCFVLNRGFYALDDTKTPFKIYLVFAILGFGVLALAMFVPSDIATFTTLFLESLLFIAQYLTTFFVLRKKIGNFGDTSGLFKSLIATGVAIVAGFLTQGIMHGFVFDARSAIAHSHNAIYQLVVCVVVALVMGLAYAVSLTLMRHYWFGVLIRSITAKLRKR